MREAAALQIHWTFGFSKDVPGSVHSLTDDERHAIVFLASHSAVIYDYQHKSQVILQVGLLLAFSDPFP